MYSRKILPLIVYPTGRSYDVFRLSTLANTNISLEFFRMVLYIVSCPSAKRKIHVVVYWMEYKNNAGSNYRPNVILNAIKDAKNRG
ncbi:MAG: hypothetical protein QXL02_03210, partial [Candidatus Anstonellales archaeon]